MDIKAALNDKSTLIFVLLAIALIVSAIVGTYIYLLINPISDNVKKSTTLVSETSYPLAGNRTNKIKMPESIKDRNEQQMSISFWIYVDKFEVATSSTNYTYKHILHIGDNDEKSNFTSWGVNAFLAPDSNKLVVILPSRTATTSSLITSSTADMQKLDTLQIERGLVFDYVPEKRWVFVTVTHNSTTKKISGYLDGELVVIKINNKQIRKLFTTTPTSGTPSGGSTAVSLSNRPDDVIIPGSGKFIWIGSSRNLGVGFRGYVGNLRFHSWEMSLGEIRKVYRMGPIDNWMARLGLPAYKLQSPIYDRSNVQHDYGVLDEE